MDSAYLEDQFKVAESAPLHPREFVFLQVLVVRPIKKRVDGL